MLYEKIPGPFTSEEDTPGEEEEGETPTEETEKDTDEDEDEEKI